MKTLNLKLWYATALLFCLNVMAAEPNTDQAFLDQVYAGNTFEIQAGSMASGKVSSTKVERFVRMMVADHGKAKKDLEDLAAKKKWTLPTTFPEKHQEILTRFSTEQGVPFERDYVKAVGDDHRANALKLKESLPGIYDPDLKHWAAKYLAVVNHHVKELDALGFK